MRHLVKGKAGRRKMRHWVEGKAGRRKMRHWVEGRLVLHSLLFTAVGSLISFEDTLREKSNHN